MENGRHIPTTRPLWRLTPSPCDPAEVEVPADAVISGNHLAMDVCEMAASMGLLPQEVSSHGKTNAKIESSLVMDRLAQIKDGKYVLVTAMNGCPLGVGKTTATIGMSQAINMHLGVPSVACIRQASQGLTFGAKGGATGGGYSQVVPMEDANLHLTGDFHALAASTNLVVAALDERILLEAGDMSAEELFRSLVTTRTGGGEERCFTESQRRRLRKLGIDHEKRPDELSADEARDFAFLDVDADSVNWNRTVDVCDRFLKNISGGTRAAGFDIVAATETMNILSLSTSLEDLRRRLGQATVAFSRTGVPITVEDLNVAGAATVLLREALKPNLMQTLEATPVLIHSGPFANSGLGCSSVTADKVALKIVGPSGYVLTEAGGGSDVGMEKFVNIKCRASGLAIDAVVLMATIRDLKMHGGGDHIPAGGPLPSSYLAKNLAQVRAGFCNLSRHVENAAKYTSSPVIVALNVFTADTPAEIDLALELARTSTRAHAAVACHHWARGGEGARELAQVLSAAVKAKDKASPGLRFLYDMSASPEEQIRTIAAEIYRTKKVKIEEKAAKKLELFSRQLNGRRLQVLMNKTGESFTSNRNIKGAPADFVLTVSDARLMSGAGLVMAVTGSSVTMPGLRPRSAFVDVEVDTKTGAVEGLF